MKIKMKKHNVLLQCMILSFVPTEANVTLTVVGNRADNDGLVCNKNATVMCQIRPYRSTMTWTIDGAVVADCLLTTCQTYVRSNYAYAFDTENGIFSITIDPIKYLDNEKVFKCDDGYYTAVDTTLLVNVLPKSSDLKMVSSTSQADTSIMVTTGCIHPSTSIKFTWQYYKDGQPPSPYMGKGFISTDEKECSSDTYGDCGGPRVVKVTSTIIIQEDPNGEAYYFQALVQHPDTGDMTISSAATFKLNGDLDIDDGGDGDGDDDSSDTTTAVGGKSGAIRMDLHAGAQILSVIVAIVVI